MKQRLLHCAGLALLALAPPSTQAQSEQVEALLERVTVKALTRGPDGAIYLAGYTYEPDLPVTEEAVQDSLAREQCISNPDTFSRSCADGYVAKLDATGREIRYATYLGGSDFDEVLDITVDPQGSACLLGVTRSEDFPITPTAAQTILAGEADATPRDLFVAKISPLGDELSYSTYLGGSGAESRGKIEIDSEGGIYVIAEAVSQDFPTTAGAYLPTRPGLPPGVLVNFDGSVSTVTKIDPTSEQLVYSTFFDRQVGDLAVDARGAALLVGPLTFVYPGFVTSSNMSAKGFVASREAFLTRLSPDGANVESDVSFGDLGWEDVPDVELDTQGNAWFAGSKTVPGSQDPGGFIAQVAPDGEILFSTDLPAIGHRLALGENNRATVIGRTSRANVPTTPDAYFSGPCNDSFAISFDAEGNVLYGSYLPFSIWSVTASYVSPDEVEFLWRDFDELRTIRTTDQPPPLACLAHGATSGRISFSDGTVTIVQILLGLPFPSFVSPGQIVDLHGFGWGPAEAVTFEFDESGRVPTSLAGVRVFFGDVPAPLLSVQDRIIRAIVPFDSSPGNSVDVEVESAEGKTLPLKVAKVAAVPAIFTLDGTGEGPAAVLNEDGTLNSPDNPAPRGSVIAIFATGGGMMIPTPADGSITPIEGPYPRLTLPVEVLLGDTVFFIGPGGQPVEEIEVLYSGAAPGLVAGVIQVNARIPEDAETGPSVGIRLRVTSTTTAKGLGILSPYFQATIAIQ